MNIELIFIGDDVDEEFDNDVNYVVFKVDGNYGDDLIVKVFLFGSFVYIIELINKYKFKVVNRIWYLLEVDFEFIFIGCYIFGIGGGGSLYQYFFCFREMVWVGVMVCVIFFYDLKDEDFVVCGGVKGLF